MLNYSAAMYGRIYRNIKKLFCSLTSPILPQLSDRTTILGFHIIEENRSDGLPPKIFEEIVKYVKDNWNIVTLENLLSNPTGEKIAFTFDDGYNSVYQYAFPILERHNVPASLFLPTFFIDGTFDDKKRETMSLHKSQFVTWNQVKETSGLITIEAHTHTHQYCKKYNDPALQADIAENISQIILHTKRKPIALAYPGGSYNDFHSSMPILLKQLDIPFGITTIFGPIGLGGFPYFCPRIIIENSDKLVDVKAKIEGSRDAIRLLQRLKSYKSLRLFNW